MQTPERWLGEAIDDESRIEILVGLLRLEMHGTAARDLIIEQQKALIAAQKVIIEAAMARLNPKPALGSQRPALRVVE